MILYADTSALMKLLIEEQGTADMQEAIRDGREVCSAAIAYVELRSALAAAFRAGRIAASLRFERLQELERLWERISEVVLDRALLRQAGELAELKALRGYDAVHLAALARLGTADVAFACWDADLRSAARQLGCPLIPV